MLVYKIFRRPEWDDFAAAGRSLGAPIDLLDGFVHLSTAAQVVETAARHFVSESDLVLVALDPVRLGAALKWEVSRGGALFIKYFLDISSYEASISISTRFTLHGMPGSPSLGIGMFTPSSPSRLPSHFSFTALHNASVN